MPHCIAFYKYDGSNLRFEWSHKTGWFKYGTRTRLLHASDPDFGSAIELFHMTLADPLDKVLREHKNYRGTKNAMAFCEYLGPNSFAGIHSVEWLNKAGINVTHNDPKELVLLDVNIYKQGIVPPEQFVRDFGHLNSAKVVYEGPMTPEFVQGVREGKYPLNEGVICKGGERHTFWMCKVKTLAYLDLLKQRFANNWTQYWE